ncbi:MAG TPA: hypothetical protein VJG49_03310 [Candidatus Nanoarchaeia archaeon]|nr:hypothetical protein [Candidatus Nanoarchaeia archaeon]
MIKIMNLSPATDYLEHLVPSHLIAIFRQQAAQKIESEGWGKQGRNVEVKIDNFVHCWTTEEAFKQLLIQKGIWFRHRGLYFGDAQGAGADFIVRINSKETSIGLRSIAPQSLEVWKTVAYPDDRFREEKERIADYHIVCNHTDGYTRFFGAISKEKLLASLEKSARKYSARNQEYFRVVDLKEFPFAALVQLLEQMEKI